MNQKMDGTWFSEIWESWELIKNNSFDFSTQARKVSIMLEPLDITFIFTAASMILLTWLSMPFSILLPCWKSRTSSTEPIKTPGTHSYSTGLELDHGAGDISSQKSLKVSVAPGGRVSWMDWILYATSDTKVSQGKGWVGRNHFLVLIACSDSLAMPGPVHLLRLLLTHCHLHTLSTSSWSR